MTTVIDNPRPARAEQPEPGHRRGGASWRFAVRLARREIRRRPGRTLLVMLLIAIPVGGMTVITVLVRTSTDSPAEQFARQFGTADLASPGALVAVDGTSVRKVGPAGASGQFGTSVPVPAFPTGTRVVKTHDYTEMNGLIATNGAARLAQVTNLDLNDPIARGIVLLRQGRVPARSGEVLLSPKLAHAFDVRVGDTLRLQTPNRAEQVVGIGVLATNWNAGLAAVWGNDFASAPGADRTIQLVDLPGQPRAAEILRYSPPYISGALAGSRSSTRAVNWILVGGIVALAIIGIVISGAFAVGARRQLVTLGQLSANGADEQLLRRTLSLQGLLSGAIGSASGFVVGVAVLLGLQHQFANLIHHDPGPYVWSPRDVVAILLTGIATATIAAYIPARSAARVPVLSALAGRRPLGTLPKRLVPIGAALFGSGVFVLALVATASGTGRSDGLALSAVFGGLLVLAGACCASSIVVAALGRAAHSARGAARVAIRSVVRSRARSAAVVMALAAANAGAIAIGTAIDSHTGTKVTSAAFMPDDTLLVSSGGDFSGRVRQFLPPPESAISALRKVLPDAQWSVRRAVVGTGEGNRLPFDKTSEDSDAVVAPSILTVTDPAVLRLIGLSAADGAALQRDGVIDLAAPSDSSASTVRIAIPGGRTVDAAIARGTPRATGDADGVFITPEKAASLGLSIVAAGMIARNPRPFDEAQKASLDVTQQILADSPNASMTFIAWQGASSGRLSNAAIRQIVLGIAVLIALVVLAMSLALSAAETRDERDVLVSLGARPSTMRAVSAWKAALLAAAGALVAIPTGFIPVAVVYRAIAHAGETSHIAFPWSTVAQLVFVAPLLAALVAYLGSAIAQRARPTRMSTFATD